MGRVEFDTITEARDWITKEIIPSEKNYKGYFTKAQELCLIPSKSTRPTVYGYVKRTTWEEVRDLFSQTSVPVYKCNNYEWDAQIGVRVRNRD